MALEQLDTVSRIQHEGCRRERFRGKCGGRDDGNAGNGRRRDPSAGIDDVVIGVVLPAKAVVLPAEAGSYMRGTGKNMRGTGSDMRPKAGSWIRAEALVVARRAHGFIGDQQASISSRSIRG